MRSTNRIYREVNNGVIAAGLATRRKAHDDVPSRLYSRPSDWLEEKLSQSPLLLGEQLRTRATRVYNVVPVQMTCYHGHFKQYTHASWDLLPALWRFTRDIYEPQGGGRDREPAFTHFAMHHYESH